MAEIIKKQFVIQRVECMVMLLSVVGVWLLGQGFMAVIMYFTRETETYFSMGTLLGIITVLLTSGIMAVIGTALYFNAEVALGASRREFFLGYYVVYFGMDVISGGLLMGLSHWENFLNASIYSGMENTVDFFPLLLKWGIPGALGATILGGFCGALFLRFGRIFSICMSVLWIVSMVGIPRIYGMAVKNPQSFWGRAGATLGKIPEIIWFVLASLVCLTALAGAWCILRKQQVEY